MVADSKSASSLRNFPQVLLNFQFNLFSQFDIILMFRIYHKLSDLHFDNYFKHCDRKYNFRSHNFKIKSKLCTNPEQFRNFFFIRIINVWNKLPQDLVSAPNIVIFRNRLKNFNLYSIASLTF